MDIICSLPVYMMNKLEDASRCGGEEGKMAAIVGTIMVSFFIITMLYGIKKKDDEIRKEKPEHKTSVGSYLFTLVLGIGIIVLVWLFVPGMVQSAKILRFQQNELMIDNLVKGGATRAMAREQLIQHRQTEAAIAAQQKAAETQARATRRAADRQASATNNQTNALLQALNRK